MTLRLWLERGEGDVCWEHAWLVISQELFDQAASKQQVHVFPHLAAPMFTLPLSVKHECHPFGHTQVI